MMCKTSIFFAVVPQQFVSLAWSTYDVQMLTGGSELDRKWDGAKTPKISIDIPGYRYHILPRY